MVFVIGLFLKQLGDLLAGEFHMLHGVAVAHGTVFAGVGQYFCAVDGDGDVADLQNAGTDGEFEHLVEGGGEEVFVFAAELADRSWSGWVSAVRKRTATFSKVRVSIRRLAKVPVA